jgi:hypothetical protein
MSISPITFGIALLGLAGCGLALLRGGPAERLGGGVILANLVLLWFANLANPTASSGVFGLVVDGLTAIGLLIVVLRYGSLWLGGAMLLYAAQFTLHSFYFVTERPKDDLHAIINNTNFLGVMICLIFGTLLTWRRRARSLSA